MENLSLKESILSLDFFSSLNESGVELIGEISYISSFESEYILYYEKKYSDKLFFLISGLAKAYKIDKHNNEIFLHYIEKNSLISDISSIKNDQLYSFSNIKFAEDSKVLAVDYKKFKEFFLENNLLTQELTDEVIKRSLMLQNLINREFIFNSIAKVAMMIDTNLEVFNTLKRQEVSLMLNIQPETLSRVLNRLKRDEIIDIANSKVTILNKELLKSLYEE